MGDVSIEPLVKSRMDLRSLITGFLGVTGKEALGTPWCRTCEQVVEDVCGRGNFTSLSGKVAIITGASNGLGLENARCLMKYGCHVVWAVRSPEKAAAVLKTLEEREGQLSGKATILKVELSDLATVKPFVEAFKALKLPLHYLICNAGIMAPTEWKASAQGYEQMFATNNLSHFLLTELLMPTMKQTAKKDHVLIVVLSSIAGAACRSIDPAKLPCLHAQHLQKHIGDADIV